MKSDINKNSFSVCDKKIKLITKFNVGKKKETEIMY